MTSKEQELKELWIKVATSLCTSPGNLRDEESVGRWANKIVKDYEKRFYNN